MYNQVSQWFKTTGSDHSVCSILNVPYKLPGVYRILLGIKSPFIYILVLVLEIIKNHSTTKHKVLSNQT